MVELLVTLLIGGLAGFVASLIMKTDGEMGWVANIAAGIVGALLVNLLIAPYLGLGAEVSGFSLVGFVMAVIGAAIVIAIVKFIQGRSSL